MNNNLLIVGAGAYGSVVKEIAEDTGIFAKISFADDFCKREDVVGTTEMLENLSSDYRYAIVAIGNSQIRKKTIALLEDYGYELPSLIHSKAYVSKTANVGSACVIEPMAVVHSNANVGNGCLICAGSVVNHNAYVDDFCQIDCNSVVGVGASVPKYTKVMYGEVVIKK